MKILKIYLIVFDFLKIRTKVKKTDFVKLKSVQN
ncbi:hypothetical protein GUU_04319 [Malacoplasma iowae 695]|nr:hypothetical protein GUU_04319 [Malacoplasma iowae 695]